MQQSKKMQAILDDAIEISRIPMILFDADGNGIASTLTMQEEWVETVRSFIASDIDTQTIGNLHYFKVFVMGTFSYVLLVLNFTSDAFMVGRLTVCQVRRLLEASEETVTKSGFLRNLLSGTLAPAEVARQAKKLKLTPVAWIAFMLEYEDGFEELPARIFSMTVCCSNSNCTIRASAAIYPARQKVSSPDCEIFSTLIFRP